MVRFADLRIKKYLVNASLLIISTGVALVLAEAGLRLVFEPVDYLLPYLVPDETLGHKIQPHSAGHDAWGFRNKTVPKRADVVAIGDSQTYGVSATAARSWPAILQELTHKSVYNLSLGGYGPVQYQYLLENKAVLLHPSTVLVGFYYGNDLKDAFNVTYRNDSRKDLRNSDFQPAPGTKPLDDPDVFLGSLREYLSHHSVLYESAVLSFGEMFRFVEMKYGRNAEEITIFEDPKRGISSGFMPQIMFNGQRLDDPNIKEGLRISLDVLLQMKKFCDARGIRFHVVLIPTKENVFSDHIGRKDIQLKNQETILALIENEREVDKLTKTFFQENQISYFDVLEPLRKAVNKTTIYPSNGSHPNGNGYDIIARAILAQMSGEPFE